jgi:uncharacterized protein YyaL (SSP411 family)
MSSSLSQQLSPYLKQHANQAVDWLPWSEETFNKAKIADKPILLSIGYASCHWCQEMSRNCFQDEYIASLMNRHFVNILVDREEMPEIDHVYMEAVRMFDQSAGWPLHAFCLPDGRPFWGGTYFPKEDLGNGLAPWSQVLIRISEHYRTAKDELIENAESVIANLCHANHADCASAKDWNNLLLAQAADKLCELHDDTNGGFTPAPKFPSPMKIDFLLSMQETHYLRTRPEKSSTVNHCISKTLGTLADSGIYDHVGGGFFRYCTDEKWTQPHYEKMLSDNALLLSTFSKAQRAQKDEKHLSIIRGIITWLKREMGSTGTGYSSSLSAESGGIEGALYEWERDDMVKALGVDEGQKFFSILPLLSNAHQRKLPQLVKNEKISIEQQRQWIEILSKTREDRTPCLRDEKRLLGHNALLVSAFTHASLALNDTTLLDDAIKLEEWISQEFQDYDLNVSSCVYPETSFESVGNLDDYCFWIQAMLDLHSLAPHANSKNPNHYFEKALKFTEQVIQKFKDPEMPGFFFTENNYQTPLPCRKKIWYDNSTPSGNSTLLKIFATLHHLSRDRKWRVEFEENLAGYVLLARKAPDGIANALTAICEDAIGILTITMPQSKLSYENISKIPSRPCFLSTQENLEKYQIKSGEGKVILSSNEFTELLEYMEN